MTLTLEATFQHERKKNPMRDFARLKLHFHIYLRTIKPRYLSLLNKESLTDDYEFKILNTEVN